MAWLTRRPSPALLAAIGAALLVTPALFITASVLKFELGISWLYDAFEFIFSSAAFDALSPVLFLGGLFGALGLNVYAITRVDLPAADEAVAGTVTVQRRAWNLAVIGISVVFLAALTGYLFLENFAPRFFPG